MAQQRAESLLFDYETTYRTAYRGGPLPELVKTEYKEKASKASRPPAIIKDTQTLTPWKNTIPFSLLHTPKEVVKSNPHVERDLANPPKIVDVDREKVQKTRPRLVMTPAVSMDDIENSAVRAVLCRDMYTSDMSKALRDALQPRESVRAPLPKHPARAKPIKLPRLQPAVVPEEWRMETAAWDGQQLRGFCDPTRDFWLRQELPKCRACIETDTIKSHRMQLKRRR